MLKALAARRVHPDLLVGTSAGALNAAYIAGYGMSETSLQGLVAIWTGLRRRDVFPLQPVRLGAAALGRAPSLCRNDGLRRLIRGTSCSIGSRTRPSLCTSSPRTSAAAKRYSSRVVMRSTRCLRARQSPRSFPRCTLRIAISWTAASPTTRRCRKRPASAPTSCTCCRLVTRACSNNPGHRARQRAPGTHAADRAAADPRGRGPRGSRRHPGAAPAVPAVHPVDGLPPRDPADRASANGDRALARPGRSPSRDPERFLALHRHAFSTRETPMPCHGGNAA